MIKKFFYSIFADITHLIFPEKCLHCSTELVQHEDHICDFCRSDISYTFFENFKEPNEMDKLFWGRIPIESTYALFYYKEKTISQTLLHALKYQNNHKIGAFYGELIGRKIKENPMYSFDALVPVPIHPKKKFTRGYNQAEIIAKGISSQLEIPVLTDFTTKLKHTESQTRKSMMERWLNSTEVFTTNKTLESINHIAIVDDVLTTGSTLEHLSNSIWKTNPDVKISFITLALTK